MNSLILLAAIAAGPAIEPVVVTATRIETPVRDVLASVELIRGEELLRQPASDLGDALRMIPGVEVVRLGGPGQQTSLFIRGTESNHVLVLMDGLRINPSIGNAAIQNIAPELVERVEIVKGPRSTLYGSEALGGVINVITRRGAEDGSSVQAGFGQYDTRTASFSTGIDGERGDASFGGSWIDSDGFPAGSGETIDRGYENLSFTAAGRAELSSVELGFRAWHAAGTTEYSQFGTPLDQDFENSSLALTANIAPSEYWDARLMAGYALDEINQNQLSVFDQNGVKDFAHTRRWSLDWQNNLVLSKQNTLTAGILWQDEDVAAESFDLPYGADTTTSQFYLQDQATLGRHRLLLAGAYTDHETFGGHATWNAEYGFEIGDKALVTAAAGTAFRAPDTTDLYGFGANPDLEPEESRSYELSYRRQIGELQSFTLTAFRNEIDNLIVTVFDPITFVPDNQNVERARIDGIEAAWNYDGETWAAHATATLQDPRDQTTDERLLRRAEENFTVGVLRRIGAHEIAMDLLYAGDREDFGSPQVLLPAYWLANLSARVALGEHFTLLLRAENLFDEEYELASGFNTMGQSFFGALRYEFR
jgi:vitamin B12 transporter